MKKTLLIPIIALLAVTGCVGITTQKQVLVKQTIFGLQLANNPQAGFAGIIPAVQFGLVRNHYISNPTSTNPVYAAPISSDVKANIGMLKQDVTETQSFGK
jgi:hypothetical protein